MEKVTSDQFISELTDIFSTHDPDGAAQMVDNRPHPQMETKFRKILQLIQDIERRVSCHLSYLRLFPFLSGNCGNGCSAAMCFMCKVDGWHTGTTCSQRQQEEMQIEAQFCPGCGVPTVRSEGCTHIVCVCGTEWDWEGDY